MSTPPPPGSSNSMAAAEAACRQLALSRHALRDALTLRQERASRQAATEPWFTSLRSLPGATVLVDAVQAWWSHHALRPVATAAFAALQPLVRRHPWALAGGALLLGGALAWTRPWRWGLGRPLARGLGSQVLIKALAALPLAAWMATAAEMLARRRPKPPSEAA